MTLLLFLGLSSMLLLGPTEGASRHRRQQPVNVSSPDWTATIPPENTGHTMNMLDLDDHAEFQNYDSVPVIPLDIKPPAVDSLEENNEEHANSNNDSLPVIPSDMKPPSVDSKDTNDTSAMCGFDYCELLELCDSDSTCMTSPFPECKSTCLPHGSEVPLTAPAIEDAETPSSRGTCPGMPGLMCVHGVPSDCNASSTEGFTCMCDPGWTGSICKDLCTLTCVHGVCGVLQSGQMFCNCEPEYIGKTCDELLPDPEEKARILAAILTVAVVVALVLIIVIPIIMWRLRVILILKLVYIFKEYEDEDGKEIDAYVSMTSSANTESFVYGFLQPILEKHNFKLFLQARDAPAGEVMSETILSALEKSRRTIMIITPDYITNEWNRFEYLIAQHEALKLHQRIIPIILEDVEKESVNMDKSLKHILDSIKCLKYPKAKPKSISSSTEEISENIQSPDSNKSVNSTTHFYVNGRSNSTVSLPKEDNQFEKKAAKFWKRLVLTMPKKKSQKNTPFSFVPILGKKFKYDINNCKGNYKSMDCGTQKISECNSKTGFLNDIHNNAFCKHSGNPCKTEDITDVSNSEANFQNDRLYSIFI